MVYFPARERKEKGKRRDRGENEENREKEGNREGKKWGMKKGRGGMKKERVAGGV